MIRGFKEFLLKNNVLALAYGIMVVFLIVIGSIWIMDHLNQNMMPANELMQMQP